MLEQNYYWYWNAGKQKWLRDDFKISLSFQELKDIWTAPVALEKTPKQPTDSK